MKKTLVALAVLSASAGAFAAVSITGKLEAGYVAQNNAWNGLTMVGNVSGFGINKSEINFGLTEDLGNNMKFIGQLGLQGADRSGASDVNGATGGAVTGGNSFLNLVTQAGTVGIGSTAGHSYLSGDGSIAGVANYDFQGNTANFFYGAATANNDVHYSVDVGPINVAIAHEQAKAGPIGTGITGNSNSVTDGGQRDNLYSLTYKIGGFAINGGYRTYDSQQSAGAAVLAALPVKKNQWRASAAYNFGVAKVAGGAISTSYVNGQPARVTWLLGAAVPVGPLTLGAQVSRITSGLNTQQAAVNAGTLPVHNMEKGNQLGVAYTATYDLSKQTSLKAAYARWQQTNTTNYNTTEVSVLLSHAF